MSRVRSLESAIFDMRDKSSVPVEEASNNMGIPANTLYQKTSPTSEIEFKVSELIPAMKAFRKFDPLDVITKSCGFLMVRIPRGKAKEKIPLPEYQHNFGSLMAALTDFIMNPTIEKCDKVKALLDKHLQDTANLRVSIRPDINQTEIDLK